MQESHFQGSPLCAPRCLPARPGPSPGAAKKRFPAPPATSKHRRPGAPSAAAAPPPQRAGQPGEGRLEGETDGNEHRRGPAGPPPDRKRLSPCNSEAHRLGLPRHHWSPRPCPRRGHGGDRPGQLPPEPRGPSPPLSVPRLKPRRRSGRPLRPPCSADAPEKAAIFAPSSAARLALPPSAGTRCALASSASAPRPGSAAFQVRAGTQPRQNGSGHRKTHP